MMNAPLKPEDIDALREYDSATVSNAIEDFKARDRTEGYTSMELRCMFPDLKPMVGYAVTCTMDTTTPGASKPNRLHEFLDMVVASPQPAVVVIQDVGSDRVRSCFVGDMICGAYRSLGVDGVVTDGGVRDVSGIRRRAPGLQLFASGVVVSHGAGAKVDLGVPVSICGLDVRPGDLLHGDENGVVSVPWEIAGSLAEQCRLVQEKEAELFAALESPNVTLEELKAHLGRPTNA